MTKVTNQKKQLKTHLRRYGGGIGHEKIVHIDREGNLRRWRLGFGNAGGSPE